VKIGSQTGIWADLGSKPEKLEKLGFVLKKHPKKVKYETKSEQE